ncbi:MAG: RNA polymerase sporulation sigma factor SigE [Ruminococcus sp.]|jgi:RNA polymerase sporulation-specific sigma factor|nr:RNA polymerase sporulation sigma factor SigE [uncultured Ruminococcus sp.]MBQ4170881.1 RNA polymerase sporulation sigma factor SigE [Ruminococcus sp.]MBQ4261102.1 RNA polymerase sporulation sigma factor SigE [Ruminococcus sp.]SCX01328.1 RNA polymerase sporulation-specific sigma factor [Ruminococcaceae bacterium P7]
MLQVFLKLKMLLLSENQVFYINGTETLPPPLSRVEEAEVMRRISEGQNGAREPLIVHNLRLVVYIAKKFESPGASTEDLISIGTIGLIKAVNTFSPEKNIRLATYASRCIENEILMFLRKSSQFKNEVSIDEPLNTDYDGNELLLCDILGSDPDEVNQHMEDELERRQVLGAVAKLNPRECQIMELRFGLNGKKEHTQKQVADQLGISQSYISRLEKKIIRRLKDELEQVV